MTMSLSPVSLSTTVLFLLIKMSICDYMDLRTKLIKEELEEFQPINLTSKEKRVDEQIVKLKTRELVSGFNNSDFLSAKKEIEGSEVFKFIKKLPKGASLHTHFLAGVGVDFIIQNFTYMDNLYGCYNDMGVFKLKFLDNPKDTWKSLKEYRREFADFDGFLKNTLTMQPHDASKDLWTKFKNIFTTLYDLVAFQPVFKKFVYQLLQELYDDNVIYTELRGTFTPLYDLDGTTHDTKFFFDTFIATVEEFKKNHPNFIGVKYIHSIYRGVDNATLKTGLEQLVHYQTLYPDFIAGFDFVGLEQDGNLVDFHNELLQFSQDLKYFFHAGETPQFGKTDLNLLDAILLNSSRIGHGFALAKHPLLLQMAAQKKIPIELSPISNQVLQLVADLRNHPAAVVLAKGHPVVICNDDPAAWGASGLSYDWYMVFMAMTWQQHGLGVLKKFAQDSLVYSAMSETEKNDALQVWSREWERFIDDVIGYDFV